MFGNFVPRWGKSRLRVNDLISVHGERFMVQGS